ncbi:hypothetical protein GOTRE_044_00870 [Gordonia terrae NBRC 100016]|uniref:Uncharacterized protein n=1 Tax=Gordonia terrae NBRC 100016 TaxID=1089454 RepID=A0ABQ0HCH5_9ACTN|nr:hypothetical protein GOTRE_044_00870 [Gordonia terrae NBRC 100016]VTR08364.1 Uncharacterised protein [Clostridioides difficile]VTS63309.1 Uncharacterised protein [Gordonia terrae]
MKVISRIGAGLGILAISATLGIGVADAAPKVGEPGHRKPLNCSIAQDFGSSHLGGPGCNALRPLTRVGPYASEEFCNDDSGRVAAQYRKYYRGFSCGQARSGFWYMTVFSDFGR